MKALDLKALSLIAIAAFCLSVNAQTLDKISKIKKDTSKM